MARRKGNSVNVAMKEIRHMIAHYHLQPGAVVSDAELAKKFNMSRTPVREAMLKLMDYGLIEREGTRMVVKHIQLEDITEILQAREAIELTAIKLIIKNGGLTSEQSEELHAMLTEIEICINEKKYDMDYKLDASFHSALISYSGNSRLVDYFERLQIQGERLRWLTSLRPARFEYTVVEHREIIEKLEALKTDEACDAMSNHLQNALKSYEEILESSRWDMIVQTLMQMI